VLARVRLDLRPVERNVPDRARSGALAELEHRPELPCERFAMLQPERVDPRVVRVRAPRECTRNATSSYVARSILRDENTPVQYAYKSSAVIIRGEYGRVPRLSLSWITSSIAPSSSSPTSSRMKCARRPSASQSSGDGGSKKACVGFHDRYSFVTPSPDRTPSLPSIPSTQRTASTPPGGWATSSPRTTRGATTLPLLRAARSAVRRRRRRGGSKRCAPRSVSRGAQRPRD
jgi:hypothetical protein